MNLYTEPNSNEWNLAEAKNKFSEVFRKAREVGPQTVRRRKDAVVIVSEEEYQKLVGPSKSLVEYIMEGTGLGELDLARDKTAARDIVF